MCTPVALGGLPGSRAMLGGAEPWAGRRPESRAPLGFGIIQMFRNGTTLEKTVLELGLATVHQAPAVRGSVLSIGAASALPDRWCGLEPGT